MKSVDVVIVGGGIVGTVLAKGIAEQAGLQVTLIDASHPTINSSASSTFNPFTDTRVIALARRTVNELAQLGIEVDRLAKTLHGQVPPDIKHIEVTDKGHIGLVDLSCDTFNIDAFGQVVSLSALTHLAAEAGSSYNTIAPAKVTTVERHQAFTQVTLDNGDVIHTKLLVLADGGRSTLSQQVGISKTVTDYQQTAIVFNVHTQLPHNHKAYERFTESGPLAFLPFDSEINQTKASGNGFSVVWTVDTENANNLMAMDDTDFIDALQSAFGYRQGRILRVSQRSCYPLALVKAENVATHRTVVVGNAAQALHPIAGQGFNLGLRDIVALIEVLKTSSTKSETSEFDAGAFAITHAYAKSRTADRDATVLLTDTLVRTFSNHHFPLVVGRNMALLTLGVLPNAKNAFVRQTTGYGHYKNKISGTNNNVDAQR
ncbi:2-octaprenyl-6-methoxyphenyl hydroxylase [Alteromonas sp. McT4-15]|uniref:2-octaprenyl-6-methoxyphenyl hydroxylase n=1 Tax=Alteromonas sp. McT4-15 TaxID=2881256 RepID=UPI001CF928FA|nr:2-octaprenyl-6-methoxyphenyl hydroxylase [Alteromonas sp. McT4-15]MCB4435050.1 2-octaprenyl-6-methoxyphenyl hydroxylase [Alteromonas sp. McT4-15]